MKLIFTKLFTTSPSNADINGAAIVISNNEQVRKIEGKVGAPFEDGYYTASLRGNSKVTIEVLTPNTTIEVRTE